MDTHCSGSCRSWLLQSLYIPDVAGILSDGSIARKLPDSRYVQDGHAGPSIPVPEGNARFLMRSEVCRQVRQVEMFIVRIEDGAKDPGEEVRFRRAKQVGEQC